MSRTAPHVPALDGFDLVANDLPADRRRVLTYRGREPEPLPQVVAVEIHDPGTGATLCRLADGAMLAGLPRGATAVALRTAEGAGVASVLFTLDGKDVRVETVEPWSIGGDVAGRLNPFDGLAPGKHTLAVTPFTGPRGTGERLAAVAYSFTVAQPPKPPIHVGETPPDGIRLSPGDDAQAAIDALPDSGGTILLRRGGTWAKGIVPRSGLTLAAWGDPTAPNPKLLAPGVISFDRPCERVVIQDIDLECPGGLPGSINPGRQGWYGIQFRARVNDLVVRRVTCRGFADGVGYSHPPQGREWQGRNHLWEDCRCVGNWSTGHPYQGQGWYVSFAADVVFRRCLSAGNGRVPGTGATDSGFRHGWYVSGPEHRTARITFEDCAAVDNSGYGIQNRAEGGRIVRCLLAGNAVGALLNGEQPVEFSGNAVVPGTHLARWYGDDCAGGGGLQYHCRTGTVRGNVFALPPWPNDTRKLLPAIDLCPRKKTDTQRWPYDGPVDAEGDGNVVAGYPAKWACRGGRLGLRTTERSVAGDWVKAVCAAAWAGTLDVAGAVAACFDAVEGRGR